MASKNGEKVRIKCYECGHTFWKTLSKHTFEVQCPKCHGYDTEPDLYPFDREDD